MAKKEIPDLTAVDAADFTGADAIVKYWGSVAQQKEAQALSEYKKEWNTLYTNKLKEINRELITAEEKRDKLQLWKKQAAPHIENADFQKRFVDKADADTLSLFNKWKDKDTDALYASDVGAVISTSQSGFGSILNREDEVIKNTDSVTKKMTKDINLALTAVIPSTGKLMIVPGSGVHKQLTAMKLFIESPDMLNKYLNNARLSTKETTLLRLATGRADAYISEDMVTRVIEAPTLNDAIRAFSWIPTRVLEDIFKLKGKQLFSANDVTTKAISGAGIDKERGKIIRERVEKYTLTPAHETNTNMLVSEGKLKERVAFRVAIPITETVYILDAIDLLKANGIPVPEGVYDISVSNLSVEKGVILNEERKDTYAWKMFNRTNDELSGIELLINALLDQNNPDFADEVVILRYILDRKQEQLSKEKEKEGK